MSVTLIIILDQEVEEAQTQKPKRGQARATAPQQAAKATTRQRRSAHGRQPGGGHARATALQQAAPPTPRQR